MRCRLLGLPVAVCFLGAAVGAARGAAGVLRGGVVAARLSGSARLSGCDADGCPKWFVSSTNVTRLPATVPGTAHEALFSAGLIGDPLYRFNELHQAWVAKQGWTFELEAFDWAYDEKRALLRFEGIDTAATVSLNGKVIGTSASAFVPAAFDVILKPKGNVLVVAIESALDYGAARAAAHVRDEGYAIPATHNYNVWSDAGGGGEWQGQEPNTRNFVRKAGSDFGWDWGPSLVPCGLTGHVTLEPFGASRLEDAFTMKQAFRPDGSVSLDVETSLWSDADCLIDFGDVGVDEVLELTLTNAAGRVVSTAHAAPPSALRKGHNYVNLTLVVEEGDVERWWPNGYGNAALYAATLKYRGTALRKRIGLREVDLVQEPVGEGTTFYFRVNGVALFAKGANLIPAKVFQTNVTLEDWRWLLTSATEANQNMVRVWGGGIYQPDGFYELCDELGLMVWQEYMFACALYPRDATFLDSVKAEVDYQSRRLQAHPSIVVWGGNNEAESALEWFVEPLTKRDLYVVDYVALYVDTVRDALRSVDLQAPFVDSSPSNGALSQEPYIKRWGNAGDSRWGDAHVYDYVDDCEDPNMYPPAKFVSEHGFQSFPSLLEYSSIASTHDLHFESDLLRFRQRHANGDGQVLSMLARHFDVPGQDFGQFLWLTQIQQGRCYETAITQWRRLRSDAAARTAGVLYWQLNDVWPGPSWSTVEHSGTWKASHYAVKRAFAPLALSATRQSSANATDEVHLHVTSDLVEDVHGVLTFEVWSWRSSTVLATSTFRVVAAAQAATRVAVLIADDARRAQHPADVFARLTWADADGAASDVHESFFYFTTMKAAALPISSNVTVVGAIYDSAHGMALRSEAVTVTLRSEAVAAYVFVEARQVGFWSDNAFLMLPGDRVLKFHPRYAIANLDAFRDGLRIRTLDRKTFDPRPRSETTKSKEREGAEFAPKPPL
ncbi:glycoside hydrolase superfamily [Pelagophyceae sp. CCMP2097]|nr:glycoside hydrolase superfamily [Pelagophyceae sp. CCMP2097]